MMAKIVQGGCFKGAVNYVLDKEKAEYLASKGVRTIDKNSMIGSFITQSKLNPITKSVAHISLNFSAQDKEKLTNKMMVKIAMDYLTKMGYGNTQLLMIRHSDRDHPHVHIVLNRIDFNGNRISDQNERLRSMKICKEITLKYGLYMSSGKENVKRHRLREPDKTKYHIYDSLTKNIALSKSWAELEKRLKVDGIVVGFKTKGATSQIEGVRFSANNLSFNGSKVDKQFSYSKIGRQLEQNNYQAINIENNNGMCVENSSSSSIASMFNILPTDSGADDFEEDNFRKRMQKKKKKGISR